MTIRRLFRALLAVALFAMGIRETVDPDMWWHLRTGELILNQGFPRQDPFSYTLPDKPWVAHEWLSDVFMWLLFRAGGLPALIIVFAGLIALTFYVIFLRTPGQPYAAGFLVLLGAVATSLTLGARPQIFNMLFGAFFIYILDGVAEGDLDRRWLVSLPLLTIPWANLHSGYLFGPVLCGVYAVGTGLDGLAQRRWRPAVPYGLAAAASMLAALLTPHGVELWVYPFETLGSAVMQQFIVEWNAPDFNEAVYQPFGLFFALSLFILIASRCRPTWTELLLFFGGGAAALTSGRNIPLFVVAVLPLLGRHTLSVLQSLPDPVAELLSGRRPAPVQKPPLRVLNVAVLALALVAVAVWSGQRIANNDDALNRLFPVDAVEVIFENGLEETRIFNRYAWGGYLIWHDIPVFVDGRADVYEELLLKYRETVTASRRWEAPLDEYGVNYVLINRDAPLTTVLGQSPNWVLLYEDGLASIFVRVE